MRQHLQQNISKQPFSPLYSSLLILIFHTTWIASFLQATSFDRNKSIKSVRMPVFCMISRYFPYQFVFGSEMLFVDKANVLVILPFETLCNVCQSRQSLVQCAHNSNQIHMTVHSTKQAQTHTDETWFSDLFGVAAVHMSLLQIYLFSGSCSVLQYCCLCLENLYMSLNVAAYFYLFFSYSSMHMCLYCMMLHCSCLVGGFMHGQLFSSSSSITYMITTMCLCIYWQLQVHTCSTAAVCLADLGCQNKLANIITISTKLGKQYGAPRIPHLCHKTFVTSRFRKRWCSLRNK